MKTPGPAGGRRRQPKDAPARRSGVARAPQAAPCGRRCRGCQPWPGRSSVCGCGSIFLRHPARLGPQRYKLRTFRFHHKRNFRGLFPCWRMRPRKIAAGGYCSRRTFSLASSTAASATASACLVFRGANRFRRVDNTGRGETIFTFNKSVAHNGNHIARWRLRFPVSRRPADRTCLGRLFRLGPAGRHFKMSASNRRVRVGLLAGVNFSQHLGMHIGGSCTQPCSASSAFFFHSARRNRCTATVNHSSLIPISDAL